MRRPTLDVIIRSHLPADWFASRHPAKRPIGGVYRAAVLDLLRAVARDVHRETRLELARMSTEQLQAELAEELLDDGIQRRLLGPTAYEEAKARRR